jgi:hypothetical protein
LFDLVQLLADFRKYCRTALQLLPLTQALFLKIRKEKSLFLVTFYRVTYSIITGACGLLCIVLTGFAISDGLKWKKTCF